MTGLTVALVLAAIFLLAGVGCVFIRITRRTPTAPTDIDALQAVHRAHKAQLRAERDQTLERLTVALADLAAERRLTTSIIADYGTRIQVLEDRLNERTVA